MTGQTFFQESTTRVSWNLQQEEDYGEVSFDGRGAEFRWVRQVYWEVQKRQDLSREMQWLSFVLSFLLNNNENSLKAFCQT